MGIIAVIENNDKLYGQYCQTQTPIITNKFPLDTPEERKLFNNALLTQYEGETISMVPSCSCKKYEGGRFKNRVCEDCGDKVLADIEKPIKFAAWLAAPKGIHALINPILFYQMYQRFNYSTYNLLEWVLNPHYSIHGKKDVRIKSIEISGIPRGLNNFYQNPEKVIDILFQRAYLKSGTSIAKINSLKNYFLFHIKAGNFFCQHLPLQSKAMFITEKTNYGTYASELMLQGTEPAIILSNVDNSPLPMSQTTKESRTVKALVKLAMYHIEDFDKTWSKSDTGAIRNHIYSSRTDWTGRAVIGSMQDPLAELDELWVPWAVGLTLFEVHVTSKLLTLGFSQADCLRIIESSISNNYSKYKVLLEFILDELIAECKLTPKFGHPCTFLRNPALTRGSSQTLRITKIKHDANDKIFNFHLLAMPSPNADITLTVCF